MLCPAKENGQLTPKHIRALKELISYAKPSITEVLLGEDAVDVKPPNIPDLIRQLNLEVEYSERLNTLKHYGFLNKLGEVKEGDVAQPSFEKAMSVFKLEELEIASNFQNPIFLLIPETSFAVKVAALNAHKQDVLESDTYVNEIYSKTDSGSEKITGWRTVIVDGYVDKLCTTVSPPGWTIGWRAHRLNKGDDFNSKLVNRIKKRRKARKPCEKGMDRHRYALLMMEAVRNGNPVDKKFSTILDDDSVLLNSDVLIANFWYLSSRIDFGAYHPHDHNNLARFRSSVGGDVLIS
ncbi:hypothetical protein KKA33_04655 [Patescibacteria group bacterium]|nr:hypothetical protein [Patescibacteria group bacterium]